MNVICFGGEFKDNRDTVKLFFKHLTSAHKGHNQKSHYTHLIPLFQSSCHGKSRLLRTACQHAIPGLHLTLRTSVPSAIPPSLPEHVHDKFKKYGPFQWLVFLAVTVRSLLRAVFGDGTELPAAAQVVSAYDEWFTHRHPAKDGDPVQHIDGLCVDTNTRIAEFKLPNFETSNDLVAAAITTLRKELESSTERLLHVKQALLARQPHVLNHDAVAAASECPVVFLLGADEVFGLGNSPSLPLERAFSHVPHQYFAVTADTSSKLQDIAPSQLAHPSDRASKKNQALHGPLTFPFFWDVYAPPADRCVSARP